MRIQLKPGLPLVRRGPSTVQIGVDPRHGTLVDGLTPPDLDLLEALAQGVDDRFLTSRTTHPQVTAPSAASAAAAPEVGLAPGSDPVRARALIALLSETGVLLRSRSGRAALARLGALRPRLAADAAAWSIVHRSAGDGWELLAERQRAVVELRGHGRTALLLAGALAAAGVGTVRGAGPGITSPADAAPGGATAAEAGLSFAAAVAAITARHAGDPPGSASRPAASRPTASKPAASRPAAGTPGGAALVVLVDRAAADPEPGDRLVANDVPHLSVVVRETSVVVGPLVLPGRTACLRCLDLHRTDRDPQWPMVLAQLRQQGTAARGPREETACAQIAAATAALAVLGHLDGQRTPACAGATLEIELPDGLASRRPWPPHPSCGCSWPPAS